MWSGFVSGRATQPASAVNTIIFILLFGTLFFLIGGLIVSFRYKLTKENHVTLLAEIERLKNGGFKNSVTPKSRQVFEQLTGWDYEKTWGNNPVGYENYVNYKNKKNDEKELISQYNLKAVSDSSFTAFYFYSLISKSMLNTEYPIFWSFMELNGPESE